jgi:bisphosphoglycerate-independent phosphoglycerate mutase (AlkP superfamily)
MTFHISNRRKIITVDAGISELQNILKDISKEEIDYNSIKEEILRVHEATVRYEAGAAYNFPNGDMVGHTGIMQAARIGVEAVDLAIGRILKVVDQLGGMAIITADHGNADEMFETDKDGKIKKNKDGSYKAKTSHTLNKVPCIFYDNRNDNKYTVIPGEYGLSNLAATVVNLLGFEKYEKWDESMIQIHV